MGVLGLVTLKVFDAKRRRLAAGTKTSFYRPGRVTRWGKAGVWAALDAQRLHQAAHAVAWGCGWHGKDSAPVTGSSINQAQ